MREAIIRLAYLFAAALFIFGLKGLSHPRTAVRGNRLGALGMLLAALAVVAQVQGRATGHVDYRFIVVALAVGTVAGWMLAVKVKMTAMPQMVALLNGFGGLASVLVAGGAYYDAHDPSMEFGISAGLSGLIGAVTFWGSLVAFGKLQELITERAVLLPARHVINLALFAGCAGLIAALVVEPEQGAEWWREPVNVYWGLALLASLLGVLLVIPIGGADMPVVISLLNSYSGLAAAATGFVVNNDVLIVSGSLVGSSGIILSGIMCKAMNRSLVNVVFGTLGGAGAAGGDAKKKQDDVYAGRVKSASPEEVAMLFDGARRVVMVPGYGLAVSQAQHLMRDLATELEHRGAEVEYAIHPVAGRMPGHMNVLLAEADVSYDKLREMEAINPTFEQTDVALIVGANDVVNPLARTDPASPIAGMPILDVDKARTVVVIKRSLSPGFAGIPNPLFAADNCLMLFGDGKKMLQSLIAAVKAL